MQSHFWYKIISKQIEGLLSEDIWNIRGKIGMGNLKRMQIFTAVTFFMQIYLLLAIDIPSINRAEYGGIGLGAGEALEIPIAFMALHISIAVTMVIGFLATKYYAGKIQSNNRSLKYFEILVVIIGSVALFLMSSIGALDQLRSGDISSFALNCLLISAFTYIIPPVNLVVFMPPYSVLLIGILKLQENSILKTTYLINSTFFFITAMILSTVMFKSHLKQLVDERKLEIANKKLDELALKDQLTGLSNRHYFAIIFEREIARLKREGGESYVAILDIDHFKAVNDQYGHPIGDSVLTDIGQLLQNNIRSTDLAARWGGEEFIILLPDVTKEVAIEIMERIRVCIEIQKLKINDKTIVNTVSIGIAKVIQEDEKPMYEVYNRADSALYDAKSKGRNQTLLYGEY